MTEAWIEKNKQLCYEFHLWQHETSYSWPHQVRAVQSITDAGNLKDNLKNTKSALPLPMVAVTWFIHKWNSWGMAQCHVFTLQHIWALAYAALHINNSFPQEKCVISMICVTSGRTRQCNLHTALHDFYLDRMGHGSHYLNNTDCVTISTIWVKCLF